MDLYLDKWPMEMLTFLFLKSNLKVSAFTFIEGHEAFIELASTFF